jgi:hypothetical protein
MIASTVGAIAALDGVIAQAQTASLPTPPPVVAAAMQPALPADPLLDQVDAAIEVSRRRYLTANSHSPWQIFHGLLALKQEFQLNTPSGRVNAIEWIATSEPTFDNQPLLMKTPHGGKFHPFTRPYAFEGHPAQFLALLSQSDLPRDYRFKVGNDHITINDIIHNTMKEVNTAEEVTWVLWSLQHYLKPDAQWVNQHNEPWSIERLVQIESIAPVIGAPCGGNHRLFALTRTRDKHLKLGGKLTGVWAQADLKIRQHIEVARSLQNSDGTFSSEFYKAPGYTTDLNKRFNTSGHTMEFLSIALPDERLKEPWVRNAVSVLCRDLIANRQRQIDCGPLYHTLNSLMIYRNRLQPVSLANRVYTPSQNLGGQIPLGHPRLSILPAPPTLAAAPKIPSASIPFAPNPSVANNEGLPVLVAPERSTVASAKQDETPSKAFTRSAVTRPGDETLSVAAPSAGAPIKTAIGLNDMEINGEVREKLESVAGTRHVSPSGSQSSSEKQSENSGKPTILAAEPPSALAPVNR